MIQDFKSLCFLDDLLSIQYWLGSLFCFWHHYGVGFKMNFLVFLVGLNASLPSLLLNLPTWLFYQHQLHGEPQSHLTAIGERMLRNNCVHGPNHFPIPKAIAELSALLAEKSPRALISLSEPSRFSSLAQKL